MEGLSPLREKERKSPEKQNIDCPKNTNTLLDCVSGEWVSMLWSVELQTDHKYQAFCATYSNVQTYSYDGDQK